MMSSKMMARAVRDAISALVRNNPSDVLILIGPDKAQDLVQQHIEHLREKKHRLSSQIASLRETSIEYTRVQEEARRDIKSILRPANGNGGMPFKSHPEN